MSYLNDSGNLSFAWQEIVDYERNQHQKPERVFDWRQKSRSDSCLDFLFMEVNEMLCEKFSPDPSDLSTGTIKKLFYNQVRSMTMRSNSSIDEKMRLFDLQFSDGWF